MIPTKDNMVRRGVIQQNMNVSAANCGTTENVNHLALDCDFFGTLWFLLRQWMGVLSVNPPTLIDHCVYSRALDRFPKSSRNYMHVVCLACVWVI